MPELRLNPGKRTYALLATAWAVAIHKLSGDGLSSGNTSQFIYPAFKWVRPQASEDTLHSMHVLIRKLGHLSEYGLLALLIWGAFAAHEQRYQPRWLVYTLLLVALCASSDEFRQSFTRMRVGSVYDILLDIAGGAIALLIIWAVKRRQFHSYL